ncbi:Sulfotransferase domain protein [Shimia sp. SK013]|uniref:sulfotransferase n=1 Tax=Shimia sp. SK013 TaxID=1389006 RepID=UPI0006B56529|nr:sulfotransferase [Shimia sp. SK013]KPA19816.1 Sulfotransferase domain protein [Shimia sp. SK013]
MSDHRLFGNLFLSIGAMKAGTTWLYTVLSRHPELHFSLEKEVHYFYHRYVNSGQLSETNRLKNAKQRYLFRFEPERAKIDRVRQNLHWVSSYLSRPVDDHWYSNLFDLRGPQTYACDFSNLTAHVPSEAWPHIQGECDKLRVLYTMRDPIKRLWSHTKFHLQITDQLEKLDSWTPEDFRAFAKKDFLWDNAEYGAVLRRVNDGLPRETWKALFYEDLHADQRGTLKSIEDFLGISNFNYPQALLEKRTTESVKVSMPEFFPELFAEDVSRIKSELTDLGFEPPSSWL